MARCLRALLLPTTKNVQQETLTHLFAPDRRCFALETLAMKLALDSAHNRVPRVFCAVFLGEREASLEADRTVAFPFIAFFICRGIRGTRQFGHRPHTEETASLVPRA